MRIKDVFRSYTVWALIALVLIGGYLRFSGLDWDPSNSFHPDERNVMGPASSLRMENGFRPRFFAYGSLQLYALRCTTEFGKWIGSTQRPRDYQTLKVCARGISAFVSTLSILIIFVVGRRLFDKRVGLLTAAFFTFAASMVQTAHYATVEPLLALWLLCAMWSASLIADKGSWQGYVLFGLFAGLGFATKTSGASFLVILGAAHLIHFLSRKISKSEVPILPSRELARRRPKRWIASVICVVVGIIAITMVLSLVNAGWNPLPSGDEDYVQQAARVQWIKSNILWLIGGSLAVASLLGTIAFIARRNMSRWVLLFIAVVIALCVAFAGWPWAFLSYDEPRAFAHQMRYEGGVVSGRNDVPYTQQYYHTRPYFYVLEQITRWTMGIPLGAIAIAGFGFAAWIATSASGWKRWALLVGWIVPFIPILVFRSLYDHVVPYKPLPMQLMATCLIVAGVAWFLSLIAALGKKSHLKYLLLLSWAFPYFIIIGGWKAKFVRYTVPLIPVLCIFGAAFLVELRDRFSRQLVRRLVIAVTIVTIVVAAFYSFAIRTIYVKPSSRIVASKWMLRHLPSGVKVLEEHWDDGLPVELNRPFSKRIDINLNELNLKYFHDRNKDKFQVYEPDNARKVDYLSEALSTADYVITASKRLYGSIMAVPERYPYTSLYYKLLFSGNLGYKHVKTITSYPRLLGIRFVDDLADESFMNYDHPKINVFKNEERLSFEELRSRFRQPPPSMSMWTMDRVVSASAPVDEEEVEIVAAEIPSPPHSLVAAFKWLLVVEILGILAIPIMFVIFRGLSDRGIVSFGKLGGILIAGYVTWILPSLKIQNQPLLAYSRSLAFLSVFALGAAGCVLFLRNRYAITTFIAERRKLLLTTELVFLFTFLFFAVCRSFLPEIFWGEKPMDFSFLNAIGRSSSFPPPETWMSGRTLNYFYYGHYLVSFIGKLAGVPGSFSFNLGIALAPALVATGTYGILRSKLQKRWGAIAIAATGVVFVIFLANISGVFEFFFNPRYLKEPRSFKFHYFWATSRVIKPHGTINEYPFWTYLFADLHGHALAMPLMMGIIGLVYNAVASAGRSLRRTISGKVCGVLFLARVFGSLGAAKSWDLPTASILMVIGFAVAAWKEGAEPDSTLSRQILLDLAPRPKWSRWLLLIRNGVVVGFSAVVAFLLFLPFWLNQKSVSKTELRMNRGNEFAPLPEFLQVWGLFIFIALCFFAYVVWRRTWVAARRWESKERDTLHWDIRRTGIYGIGYSGAIAILLVFCLGIAAIIGLTGITCLERGLQHADKSELSSVLRNSVSTLRQGGLGPVLKMGARHVTTILFVMGVFVTLGGGLSPRLCFASALLTVGIGVVGACEYVTVIDRMNTIFKYYFAMWPLFAIPCAWIAWGVLSGFPGEPSLSVASGEGRSRMVVFRSLSGAGMVLLGALAVFTTVTACCSWLKSHDVDMPVRKSAYSEKDLPTLDGTRFMARVYPEEYAAIQWLNSDNVPGIPVLLEASKESGYGRHMRITMNTGIPTVVGWKHHLTQRAQSEYEIGRRLNDVSMIYSTKDKKLALKKIKEYGISLIYVGWLERETYPIEGLAKFDEYRSSIYPVYANTGVKIYGVESSDLSLERTAEIRKVDVVEVQPAGPRKQDPEGVFHEPRGVAVAPDGSLYVADFGNSRIQKLSSQMKCVAAWGKKGPALGEFNEACGVAVDGEGNLWVADTFNGRIQKFTPEGEVIDIRRRKRDGSIEGNWGAMEPSFSGPRDIEVDDAGNIYVSDTSNHRVVKLRPDGTVLKSWGKRSRRGDRWGSRPGQFKEPVGIAVAPDGDVYVCDTKNGRVQRFTDEGDYVTHWDIRGWSDEHGSEAYIDIDAAGTIWISDPPSHRLLRFTADGKKIGAVTRDARGRLFKDPKGIAINKKLNKIYVVDRQANQVLEVNVPPLDVAR